MKNIQLNLKIEYLNRGYVFLPFVKDMGINIGKSPSKSLSDKYSQKLLDHANKSATNAFKATSKKVIQKKAEATGDQIGNKIC